MTLGEKIQTRRRLKGLSQEEVASALGVSRQALSKWECNTSTPDIDKIVALSNYFNVTTDYFLKDGCTDENLSLSEEKKKQSSNIPITVSTTIITIGLIIALAMANDGSKFFYWKFSSAAIGIGIQIIGIAVFEILYFRKLFQTKNQYIFWSINTWLLSAMPIILLSSGLAKISNGFEVDTRATNVMLFYFIFNGVLTLSFFILSKIWHAKKCPKSSLN